MIPLEPLQQLFPASGGDPVPLPAPLRALYGPLFLPPGRERPRVVANFVSSLDGVTDLGAPGKQGGAAISGSNRHDRMVMGLLRAAADAVVVGAGTLRSVPRHFWTAEYIFPELADAYRDLRAALGKEGAPLNVFVSARGEIDCSLPVFRSGEVPILIVTTRDGARRLRDAGAPKAVRIVDAAARAPIAAAAVLDAIAAAGRGGLVLLEGGPTLFGRFLAERRVDELFLTLAPQLAGRDGEARRPGLVEGERFAPENPVWGTLTDVRRGGSHLFLRYSFR